MYLKGEEGKITLRLSNGVKIESDIYLVALGRTASGLEECTGCDAAGVKTMDRGQIPPVNKVRLETDSRNVVAAGDVVG